MLVPYSLFFLAAVLLLICSRKKHFFLIIVITVFMVAWRTKWTISSSRYFIAYLLVSFSAIALALRVVFRKYPPGKIFCLCALLLACINIMNLFSGFRNLYVFDIEDQVRDISFDPGNKVFINEKDHKRLSAFPWIDELKTLPGQRADIEELCNRYDFCGKDSYLFFRDNRSPLSAKDNRNLFGDDIDLHKIQQFYTDKKKHKTYSVFFLKKYDPPLYHDPSLKGYTELEDVIKNGTLECYNLTSDSYIFRDKDSLFWVIGGDIEKNAEIVFHVFTERLDLLPRGQKRFDNRGFRPSSRSRLKDCGKYMVFKQSIPKEYPISKIRPGLNNAGKVIWFREFQISNMEHFETTITQ